MVIIIIIIIALASAHLTLASQIDNDHVINLYSLQPMAYSYTGALAPPSASVAPLSASVAPPSASVAPPPAFQLIT